MHQLTPLSVNHEKVYEFVILFRQQKMYEIDKSNLTEVVSGRNKCTSLLLKKYKLRKKYLKEEVSVFVQTLENVKNHKSNSSEVVSRGNKHTSFLLKKCQSCKKMFIRGSLYFCLDHGKCLKIIEASHLRQDLEVPNALNSSLLNKC